MSEKTLQQTAEKTAQKPCEPIDDLHDDIESDEYIYPGQVDIEYDGENNLDMEQEYLSKLKIQRKRIEDLLNIQEINLQKLKDEQNRNRKLQEQIEKLSSYKDKHSSFLQSQITLESTLKTNASLKQDIDDLKREMYASNNQKNQIIQKLKLELGNRRNKEQAVIEALEEELNMRQEQIEKLQSLMKAKERQYNDTINGLKINITKMQTQHSQSLTNSQKRCDRLERQLQTKTLGINQIQSNIDSLLKENVLLKEEVFRVGSQLNNRQQQIRAQAEKFKSKLSSMKRQMKVREKQSDELKESMRKQEKLNSDNSSESTELRSQIKILRESNQLLQKKLAGDFTAQRNKLINTINQHVVSINELVSLKNQLLEKNSELEAKLKRKSILQSQRRQLLRTEMKQIDKLQKVIDRIVE